MEISVTVSSAISQTLSVILVTDKIVFLKYNIQQKSTAIS